MIFNDFAISGSGLYLNRKWMDALSDNIANINNVVSPDQDAFQERFIEATSANVNGSGGGVAVSALKYGSKEGRLRYDPTNPLADEKGYVKGPDMDLSDQMTNLIIAQRGYQANVQSLERARNIYEQALQIGRS
jgi:flagellar basal-body rod protein FlgC